ncbi:uncharacterized protein HKW66_Vig0105970 [Vigna angularis]|uniref:CCHC-type domain-containing protein n=1 Tax=Phaseolus angularis TaxID=3914 RepID=A0A8T0KHV3_PHAAN|nr:uncharacterized protein HKW66_Vig0105970 [Vigna angularis]
MKNRNIATDNVGYSRGGKKSSRNNTVQYYECEKDDHIKPDCQDLKNRQKINTNVEEESNLCFIASSAHYDEDNDDDFESEPIEVKYDLLLDAFQEIHREAMRL